MNNYELVVILNKNISDEEKVSTAAKIKEILSATGEVSNIDEWGRKELAYEIKGKKEGFYILYTFTSNPEHITEYERLLKLDEKVLKHMIVKI